MQASTAFESALETTPESTPETRATGPRTSEAKAVSRLNSLKHGLTGAIALVPGESQEEYDQFIEDFLISYEPDTPVEHHLVREIAEDKWRIRRLRRLETVHLAEAIENCVEPDEKRLNLYSLYESRIERNIKNNEGQLHRLQTRRKQESKNELLAEPEIADPDTVPFPVSLIHLLPEDVTDRLLANLKGDGPESAAPENEKTNSWLSELREELPEATELASAA